MAPKSIVRVVRQAPVAPARAAASPASRVAPLGFHLILRLTDDRVIARTAPERRVLARAVYASGTSRGLLAFRAADTHLHILMVGSRREAGLLARYVAMSLRWQLGLAAPFERCRIRPIHDQRHLENAVRYVFGQEQRHGIDSDPLHDASSLPELLGLRALGDVVTKRLLQHLPRFARRFTSDLAELAQGNDADDTYLLEGTLAAIALSRLGRDIESQRARRAAVHVSAVRTSKLAKHLGVDATSVRRWRKLPPDQDLVEAIKRQMRARAAIAARPRD